MLVLMSPIYDRVPHAAALGPWHYAVSGGWLTAADIAVKFALGVLALTAIMCTTRFALLLEAMRRLAMPQMIVMQLGFLYHYHLRFDRRGDAGASGQRLSRGGLGRCRPPHRGNGRCDRRAFLPHARPLATRSHGHEPFAVTAASPIASVNSVLRPPMPRS